MNPKEYRCHGCYRERLNLCALLCQDLHINTLRTADRKPKNCPCMICIIKVICNDACDDRSEFWQHEYDRIWDMPTKNWLYSGIIEGW